MKNEEPISLAYAEDHVVVRKGVIALINSLGGIRVDIEAGDGKELLAQISKAEHKPDVCLLDINMPVMNGLDTLTELRKKWPDIGVLVLSGVGLDMVIVNMIMKGANGYLLKNCRPEEVKEGVLSVYNDGIYFSNVVTRNYFHGIRNKEIRHSHFTENELNVLKKCCSSLSYAEIAKEMNTTTRSVEGLRDSLFKKLQMNNRVSLAMFAVQTGIVPIEGPIFNGRRFMQ